MKSKDTVFGSKIEKKAFASVQSRWSDRFNVYLSLPFSNIIDFVDNTLRSGKYMPNWNRLPPSRQ